MKIIRNNYQPSFENYFIPLTHSNRKVYGIKLLKLGNKWLVQKAAHYKPDIYTDSNFEVVGKINLKKVVIDAVLKAVKENK